MKGLTIAIADDDAAMRRWLRTILERAGARVIQAGSGAELLQLLADEDDVAWVISDVRMPSGSGLQILAMVRTAGYALPYLLITAFGGDEVRVAAARLHAAVLDKPFSAALLLATLRRAPPLGPSPPARMQVREPT